MENKVIYGLKNAHYAVVTEAANGTYTYGTPVKIPGATELGLDPKGDTTDFYADDVLYHTVSTNQGYEATLTIAALTEAFRTDVLGEILDATDKVLTEVSSAKPKKIAFMFEFDGDTKATRHVLYSCSVTRPGISSKSKTNTSEPGTTELKLVAGPRPSDEKVKTSTTTTTPSTVYDAWFTEVYDSAVTP